MNQDYSNLSKEEQELSFQNQSKHLLSLKISMLKEEKQKQLQT